MLRFDPKNIKHIEDVENMFLDLQNSNNNLQNNKIHYKKELGPSTGGSGRHYYPRPTPQDILFEKKNMHPLRFYSGSDIYC